MMKCIFCKGNSQNCKSVEHIVPESLGNKNHVLPTGVVCDDCNNYFATKVEKLFLESGSIKTLRHYEALPNKRGHIPPLEGILLPHFPARIWRSAKESAVAGIIDIPSEAFEYILEHDQGELILPANGKYPDDFVVSRFLAKMGLEVIAARLLNAEGGLAYIVEERQFDPIRRHARYGEMREWPYNMRRIYPADRKLIDSEGKPFQTIFEYDLWFTPLGELYFIIAVFGLELAINIAGPDIEGYKTWLKTAETSPLYFGKNSQ